MARDPRYSRIKEAARLQSALTAYHNYLQSQLTDEAPTGTPASRPATVDLYAQPFAYDLPDAARVRETAQFAAWSDFSSHFANRTETTEPAPENIVRIRNYKLPRVSILRQYQTTGTYEQSSITNLHYIKYGGITQTIPFGPDLTAATKEKMATAFEAIRAGVEGASFTPPPKAYFIPEKS
jgi:hypothetical protein